MGVWKKWNPPCISIFSLFTLSLEACLSEGKFLSNWSAFNLKPRQRNVILKVSKSVASWPFVEFLGVNVPPFLFLMFEYWQMNHFMKLKIKIELIWDIIWVEFPSGENILLKVEETVVSNLFLFSSMCLSLALQILVCVESVPRIQHP